MRTTSSAAESIPFEVTATFFFRYCHEKEVFEYKSKIQEGVYDSHLNPIVMFTLFLMLDTCLCDPYLERLLNNFGMSTIEFYREANKLLDDILIKRMDLV